LTPFWATYALFAVLPVRAASLLDYRVTAEKGSLEQAVIIRDGAVLVKAAGGDENLDVLWESQGEKLTLIDHRRKDATAVTEARVRQLAGQFEAMRPLIRGISEQVHKLSPKQRAKWESMLGGVPLEQLAAELEPARSAKLVKTGGVKEVAGVRCEEIKLAQSGAKSTDVCLARPDDLRLSAEDAAALESLLGFTRKLAAKAEALAGPLGFRVQGLAPADLTGIPVEIREHGHKHPLVMSLREIGSPKDAGAALAVPEGYRAKPLNLW
jgi:hypothetical protein